MIRTSIGTFAGTAGTNDSVYGDPDENFATVHSFGWALERLKAGYHVFRAGWNGKGMYILLRPPHPEDLLTKPFLVIRTAQADYVPWVASRADLLEEDWAVDRQGPMGWAVPASPVEVP